MKGGQDAQRRIAYGRKVGLLGQIARSQEGDPGLPAGRLEARIAEDARTLVRALGYDMNSIEFAIRGGIPYAIDFMNPAPDLDIYSLTPTYFEWTVRAMADMAIRLAKKPRRQSRALKWDAAFTAGR